MPLGETVLDELMERFDQDSDGSVSFDEFKAVMHEQQRLSEKKKVPFWKSFGGKDSVKRTLDVAYQMSDIDAIQNMGDESSDRLLREIVGKRLAPITLVVYLKDVPIPLVIMCSKPDHVVSWEEAFRKCIEMQAVQNDDEKNCDDGKSDIMEEWDTLRRSSTIDWE